ncbi:hypothetical protein CIP107570_00155 [Corynebacterium diphtheriae]|nr:hypothetical protein CIP107570_00155 [Corynebacterium diphtheriae]
MSLSAVIERSGSLWQHPRIMKTTGRMSHTGPVTIPIIGDTHKVTGPAKAGAVATARATAPVVVRRRVVEA